MAKFNSLKYQLYRSTAMQLALDAFASDPNVLEDGVDVGQVRLEPITQKAIDASSYWGDDATLYPWGDVLKWKARDLKGFDLSIWFGPQLCGMCYATPRKSAIQITVILLEGKPGKTHPLKGYVMPLALAAVGNYGRACQLAFIEIEDPSRGAVPLYQELGFVYDDERRLVISLADA